MFAYNDPASFVIDPSKPGTIDVSGTLYRAIPHSSQDPLSTQQSLIAGGRWNPPGSFPVLYTGSSMQVIRSFIDWHATYFGIPLATRPRDELPDLAILSFTATVADVASDDGLAHYGLPTNYPEGFSPNDHSATRPIGVSIYALGMAGIATRSATMSSWNGPISSWAEVAIFTAQSPTPILVDRLDYRAWYPSG